MKLIVNVSIPAISEQVDVMIPIFLTVKEVVPLIASSVEEISAHKFISSGHGVLCRKEDMSILPENKTIAELRIQNGDHLVLI